MKVNRIARTGRHIVLGLVLTGMTMYGLGGCSLKSIGADILSGIANPGSTSSLTSGLGSASSLLSQLLGAAT